jgi:hypothetical protein
MNEDEFGARHIPSIFATTHDLYRPICSCGWQALLQPTKEIASVLLDQHIEQVRSRSRETNA